jgi:hypothetical protein
MASESPGIGMSEDKSRIPRALGARNGVIIGYMDLTDYECELGVTDGGSKGVRHGRGLPEAPPLAPCNVALSRWKSAQTRGLSAKLVG